MLHLWMDIVLLSRHPASIHRPVHRFSETVYQPVPNPDGPVILVPSLGWIRTGMDPHEGEGGPLVCGFDPWKTRRPQTSMMEAAATGGGWRPWWWWFLEVESALAVEAAWELKEAVASMDGSLNMDADTSLDLHRVRRRWVDLRWQGRALPPLSLTLASAEFQRGGSYEDAAGLPTCNEQRRPASLQIRPEPPSPGLYTREDKPLKICSSGLVAFLPCWIWKVNIFDLSVPLNLV